MRSLRYCCIQAVRNLQAGCMEIKRTQASRTEATRAALVAAARPLFAERGFAAVGTDELARAAGVTRGALYRQFAGTPELSAAVFQQVEDETAQPIWPQVLASGAQDPVAALRVGVDAWLAACEDPDVHRIVLIEAPAALGWERWREIGHRYGVGLVEATLAAVIEQGILPRQPGRPIP